jgi:hypothetical protein
MNDAYLRETWIQGGTKAMKTMKRSVFLLLAGASMLGAGAAPFAGTQSIYPDNTSVPVIPPGKAGDAQVQPAPPASPAINITVAQLMSRPEAYIGRNVTIVSEVEEVFTPWSFKLDEDRLLSGGIDNDLLVIGREPLASMGFREEWIEQPVRVTGTVRILQASDFRREYGRGVDDKLFRRYEGKPALIATSIQPPGAPAAPQASGAPAGGEGNAQAGVGAAGAAGAAGAQRNEPRVIGRGIEMECRPSSVNCPVTESSGSSVTTTDALPLGSAPPADDTVTESKYPTSPGSGSMGSGLTGSPVGPGHPGPTTGIGR